MRTSNLTLGLALEAASRGFEVRRKSDSNVHLEIKDNIMYLCKDKGKDINLFKSALFLDFGACDWYLVEDNASWLKGA